MAGEGQRIDAELVGFASQLTKTMAEAQTLSQGFIDENLAFPALDTKRDAGEWVEALTKMAAGAWLLGLKGTVLMTRTSSQFVGGVLKEANKNLKDAQDTLREILGQ
jgi:hypothetical protein